MDEKTRSGCELAGVMQEIAGSAIWQEFRPVETRETAFILIVTAEVWTAHRTRCPRVLV